VNSIFSISYIGSIRYWSHLVTARKVVMEQHCHFGRQTYRNRCNILAANGVLPLSIPIVKPDRGTTTTRDAQISYDTPWLQSHWRSIVSAYNGSPFFEFYADDYEKIYSKKFKFLWDLNMELLETVMDNLELNINIEFTTGYYRTNAGDNDLRETIHPKKDWRSDKAFTPIPYRQVFSDKFGFIPELSVIDLIFNKGPESRMILRQCMSNTPIENQNPDWKQR